MFRIHEMFIMYLCCTYFSCSPLQHGPYIYTINIQEINFNTQHASIISHNKYMSYDKALFEYEFKEVTNTVIDAKGQQTFKSRFDSTGILFIPENKLVYYKYDLKGNFILRDSVNKLTSSFIKINPEHDKNESICAQLNKIKPTDLYDSVLNGTSYKVYKSTQRLKDDSLGEIVVQLFFIKKISLKTPFNVNGRYPNILNDLCFTGACYHALRANSKMIFVISDIEPLTKEQKTLCDLIYTKVPK